ncbi:carbonic anhydrase 9-like [Ostrinia nubilalis]|uniref:carbonic anhydrase 9-like n=1 Tax=Ostrinia nubilalis TaxID=29057 RepID=UPI00308233C7
MILNVVLISFISYSLLLSCNGRCARATNFAEATQDQTSARANTLLDDADDIQRQLDNEARDRIKYGRPKTIWVFHFPTQFPDINLVERATRPPRKVKFLRRGKKGQKKAETLKEWSYKDQRTWPKIFPDCGGRSQSPVDVPYHGLVGARAGRKLVFKNYDVKPDAMKFINDGNRVTLIAKWKNNTRPYIYGGAAHSRRYVFHSLTLHWPSEHTVGGLQYPIESQVMHLSAEYNSMEEALQGSVSDPLAFLAVSTLYRYSNHTQEGLNDLIKTAVASTTIDGCLTPKPLSHFSPPFKEYACYQGSMTAPPCTEAVLWLIRGRTLPVTRVCINSLAFI